MSKLTLKQKLFADEYIICRNATEAAVKAGYSQKYANTNASKLLQNTTLKKYIDERLKILEKETIATQDEVLQYLTSVMRGEHTEQTLIGVGEGSQDIVDIEVSAKDRLRAAIELNKLYSARQDKEDNKELKELQKEKIRKEIHTEVSTEHKLSELFDKIDGVLDET